MGAREEKQLVVKELSEKLRQAKGTVLADYRGLNVEKVTDLRNKLRAAGIEYKVVKNTLLKLAADEAGIEGLEPYLEGPTALAMSVDPVAPAKVLSEWIKANKMLELKGGIVEGKVIDQSGVTGLADLPPREVLLAMVVGAIGAPISGMVNVLHGPLRKLVYAVDAVAKQKEA